MQRWCCFAHHLQQQQQQQIWWAGTPFSTGDIAAHEATLLGVLHVFCVHGRVCLLGLWPL